MDLAPIQHEQFNNFFKSWHPDSPPKIKASPTHRAFRLLYVLNGGIFAILQVIESDTRTRFNHKWPSTLTARWLEPYIPSAAYWLEDYWYDKSQTRAGEAFLKVFATSMTTFGSTWWTVLTSTFTHTTLEHLVSNVASSIPAANVVARLPGMSAWHVLGITVGCSLATSATGVYRIRGGWYFFDPQYAFGFSGVVCALYAIAMLGSPGANIVSAGRFGLPRVALPLRRMVALQVYNDLAATVRLLADRATGQDHKIGTLQHLVGYTFGAAYYMVFLRPRRPSTFETGTGRRLDVGRRASI